MQDVRLSCFFDQKLVEASVHAEQTQTGCTLETDFFPILRKGLKLHLFNGFPCCLCCGEGTCLFFSLCPGLPRGEWHIIALFHLR